MSETYMKIEALIEAFHRRRRPDWPEGFEEAMKHPIYSRLIRIQALHEEVRAIVRKDPVQRVEPPPASNYRPRLLEHLEGLDMKRRASGEREGD